MKTRKIVSVICTLAMLISVFGAFALTANADVAPVVSLIKTDATLEDGSNLVYDVVFSGMQEGDKVGGFSVTTPVADPFTYDQTNVVSDKAITKSAAVTAAGTVVINYASAADPFVADANGEIKVATITLGVDSTKATEGETYTLTPSAAKITINDVSYASAKGALTIESDASVTVPKPELPQKVILEMTKAPTVEDKTVTFDIVVSGFEANAKMGGFSVTIPVAAPYTYDQTNVVSDKAVTKSAAVTAAGTVVVNYASAADPFVIGEDGTVTLATITLGIDDADMANGSEYAVAPSAAKVTVDDVSYASAKDALTIKGFTVVVGGDDEEDPDPTPTPTPPVDDKPEEVPAFETEVKSETKTIAGDAKVKVFTATIAPAEGSTVEEVTALLVDDEYQVIFDGKTEGGYTAGWAIATVSAETLKDALANGTSLVNAEISIGGADEVTVSVLDSEGNTVVLAAE